MRGGGGKQASFAFSARVVHEATGWEVGKGRGSGWEESLGLRPPE